MWLYGKDLSLARREILRDRISYLKKVPKLAIFLVGNNPSSEIYVGIKSKFAEKIGAETEIIKLAENISEEELIKKISEKGANENVTGMIVQLPLPAHIDFHKIVVAVPKEKDADGLHPDNYAKLENGEEYIVAPATALGVKILLENYGIQFKDKKVCVIGRSYLVGRPIALIAAHEGAEVTVCHRQTENIPEKTQNADIVIVATGQPHFFGAKYFKAGQIVIDVGITKKNDQIYGDVAPEVENIVEGISPVPGGVGPMTVVCLFENLVRLAISQESRLGL